jgi:hypothetical protein
MPASLVTFEIRERRRLTVSLRHVIVASPALLHGMIPVNGTNIIERAYQLATESGSIEEIKRKLMREGYVNVHAHLGGRQIRHDLLERLNPRLTSERRAAAHPFT